MDYSTFLENKKIECSASGFEPDAVLPALYDFQRDIVIWAIRRGKAAIFADCGLGKTPMQLEWGRQVYQYTKSDVLILAPLAVSQQTKREGDKFGIPVNVCRSQNDVIPGINVTNYEMLHKFDPSYFSGIVLDESSILKSFTGKFRNLIISSFQRTPYKLACTATPAPNDYMELGNHSEFLNVLTRPEMLSLFFINDASDTGKWRLKGHAEKRFWEWLCSWAVMIKKPSDLGYKDGAFILPPLTIHEHVIEYGAPLAGRLLKQEARTMDERRRARKESIQERTEKVANLVNRSNGSWLIWCNLNAESELAAKMTKDAVEVRGSDTKEEKERRLLDFSKGKIRVMVTKPKIAGFGMNWQHCSNMVFLGLSDSYESFYQAVRRCWRFGQEKEVDAHIVTADIEGAVVKNIKRKEKDAQKMHEEMVLNMSDITKKIIKGNEVSSSVYKERKAEGENWTMYLGDCVEISSRLEDDSVDYSIFSPPFSSLFTYTDSERDMGNSKGDEEFFDHFNFLVKELFRITLPGRLVTVHCMQLPATMVHEGYIGMRDFRGEIIWSFQKCGFIYHSEVCIWKDPLIQATRTKMLTLAHKQVVKDSTRCAQGFPDYLVVFRKPGDNPKMVKRKRGFEYYIGEMPEPLENKTDNPRTNKYSHKIWQRYASPVWFDIRQTRTLNEKAARDKKDERHICPLQLDVIERCLELWTKPGDLVFSPFAGIGSELYCAVRMGRSGLGIELKNSYFREAIRNLKEAERQGKYARGGLLV